MRTVILWIRVLALWASLTTASATPGPVTPGTGAVHHELRVILLPAENRLEAEDTVTLGGADGHPPGPVYFLLHADLEVESADPRFRVEPAPPQSTAREGNEDFPARVPVKRYSLRPTSHRWPPNSELTLRYGGAINPASRMTPEGRSGDRRQGIIDSSGAVLFGSTYWVPWFEEGLASFRLAATVPVDWSAVSQGQRTGNKIQGETREIIWESPSPMDAVYLIAGPFKEYSSPQNGIATYAFLREADTDLAMKYLRAAGQYMAMYERLIGPYPYGKFALVENFWETGYGMPSFTLLGSSVIRLPFILYSSYPHEILHNWWGNSVYVDYSQGNWSEGLTTYLADHLMKEQQGRAIEYRRDTLASYRDYVTHDKDLPLSAFHMRHSPASQAVGYGKSLMLWHMLRLELGDQGFIQGLRRIYEQYRFRRASYADLERTFAGVAKRELTAFFRQWVQWTGAPGLALEAKAVTPARIRVRVKQNQPGRTYRLTLPLAFTVTGEPEALLRYLTISEREASAEFTLPAPVLRVDLDPYFDIFRHLDPRETPPTLSELLGAERTLIVLPEDDAQVSRDAWRNLAESWSRNNDGQVSVVEATRLKELPHDGAVWVLGKNNGWRQAVLDALQGLDAGIDDGEVLLDGTRLPEAGHSFVFTARHPERPGLALAWIGTDRTEALPGMARKTPHYGKYSYLAFAGDTPTNVAKGQWPVPESPLTQSFVEPDTPGTPIPPATLPPRPSLANLADRGGIRGQLQDRLLGEKSDSPGK